MPELNQPEPIEIEGKLYLEGGQSEAGWHRTSTILTCPRLFALGRSDVPREPLVKGTLAGIALNHIYAPRMKQWKHEAWWSPDDAVRIAAGRMNAEAPSPLWHQWAERLQGMGAAYLAKWGRESAWEVVGVECELRVFVRDESRSTRYLYTQRADVVVRNRQTGVVFIVDHKTSYALIPSVTEKYTLSGQRAGYGLLGAVYFGSKYGGTIFSFMQLPDADPAKEKTFAFKRPTLAEASFAIDNVKNTVIYANRLLATLREDYGHEAEVDPMSWPGVYAAGPPCLGPYKGQCEFRDRCRRG